MIKHWLAPALVVAMIACLWGSPAAQAAHQWSPISMSQDGQRWSAHPSWSVFRGQVLLIPGQTKTRTLYVRNQGPTNARLLVTVPMRGTTSWASRGLKLQVGHAGTWKRVTKPGQKALALRIKQGGVAALQVRLTSQRGSHNWSQNRSLNFVLKLRLTHYGKGNLR